MSARLALLASILIHGIFAWLLLDKPTPRPTPTPVEIEYRNTRIHAYENTRIRASKNTRIHNLRGEKFGAKFRPRAGIPSAEQTALNPERDALARGSSEWPEGSWGSKMNLLGEVGHFLENDRVREEIRNMLNYPGALAMRNIEGHVEAQLYFTDDSKCDWKRTTITSGQPYLRIYILAMLKKLCTFTVVERMRADHRRTLDLTFQFDIVNEFTADWAKHDDDFVAGHVIGFRRTAMKSVAEYQIGPIRGVWFVPAVALDFPWLVEKWDQYVNGIDPLAAFRE